MFPFNEEWFWTMIECIIVGLTAVLIYLQIRTQTRSHVVASTESMVALWNTPTTLRLRHDVCVRWANRNTNFSAPAQALAEVFETFGLYAKVGAIPHEIMWDMISWPTEYYYCMFETGIAETRTDFKDALLFKNFELMNDRFNKISASKGIPPFDKTDDIGLQKFLRDEIEVCATLLAAPHPVTVRVRPTSPLRRHCRPAPVKKRGPRVLLKSYFVL